MYWTSVTTEVEDAFNAFDEGERRGAAAACSAVCKRERRSKRDCRDECGTFDHWPRILSVGRCWQRTVCRTTAADLNN